MHWRSSSGRATSRAAECWTSAAGRGASRPRCASATAAASWASIRRRRCSRWPATARRTCHWLEGRAEAIPLEDGAVERAFMQTVVHLVEDRDAACAELRRVVGPDGDRRDPHGRSRRRRALLDGRPDAVVRRDRRGTLPGAGHARRRARAAGFGSAAWTPAPMRLRYTREEAAHLLRERFASSLALHLRRRDRSRRSPRRARPAARHRAAARDGAGASRDPVVAS